MTSISTTFFIFFFSSISFASVTRAQGRTHGLIYQNPIAFSPSAYQFFHPNAPSLSIGVPCSTSCSSSSTSSTLMKPQATQLHETNPPKTEVKGYGIGVGGVGGLLFGFVFAVLLAMGVYYVLSTRRANAGKANAIGPDLA